VLLGNGQGRREVRIRYSLVASGQRTSVR